MEEYIPSCDIELLQGTEGHFRKYLLVFENMMGEDTILRNLEQIVSDALEFWTRKDFLETKM